jgi:hypothetical protein
VHLLGRAKLGFTKERVAQTLPDGGDDSQVPFPVSANS